MNEIYTKVDVTLPYHIETKYYKSVQDGILKERYERKFLVLNENVNDFVLSLEPNYQELSLTVVNKETTGGISTITATYGEAGLTDETINEDGTINGSIFWWSYASGIYTYHYRTVIKNDPDSIKAFIEHCKYDFDYNYDEVTVSLNPNVGEPNVVVEASFTRKESDEQQNNFDEEAVDAAEDGIAEDVTGVQFSSSYETVEIPNALYLEKNGIVDSGDTLDMMKKYQSGEYVWYDAEDEKNNLNGIVKETGWYDANNKSIQSIEAGCITQNPDKEQVTKAIKLIENKPSLRIPVISVVINERITSKDDITIEKMKPKLDKAGQRTDTIKVGKFTYNMPEHLKTVKDSYGNEYTLSSKWCNEGYNFSGNTVKRSYQAEQKMYYAGECSQNFRSESELEGATCADSTESQTI